MFRKVLFGALLFLSPFSALYAQQNTQTEETEEENSPSQAQATMASLFGRGATMPGLPRIDGTIALPSFDNSGMKIDEDAFGRAQRAEGSSGNGKRSPGA